MECLMFFYPNREQGSVITGLLAVVIVSIVAMGFMVNTSNQYNAKLTMSKKSEAVAKNEEFMFRLMNSPWLSSQLTAGKHNQNGYRWKITNMTTRLKKIELTVDYQARVGNKNSGKAITLEGYKYYEY